MDVDQPRIPCRRLSVGLVPKFGVDEIALSNGLQPLLFGRTKIHLGFNVWLEMVKIYLENGGGGLVNVEIEEFKHIPTKSMLIRWRVLNRGPKTLFYLDINLGLEKFRCF